jgi:hypothetical protein
MKRIHFIIIILAVAIGVVASKPLWWSMTAKLRKAKTVADRLQEFGSVAQSRLVPHFEKAGLHFPPGKLIFVGIKNKGRLEIYASSGNEQPKFIRFYPILRASGDLGPKLKEGDRQVPEGIYKVESLNPNSSYHVSLRVSYPNQFDREQARKENRTNLGGDIMIHGKAVSIGCLAMGDEAAEDLFTLAALTGIENIEVILTPVDFRREQMPALTGLPSWAKPLYEEINNRLSTLPLPN